MRKNIDIPNESVKVLEKLAERDGRSVKNYMERILTNHAYDFAEFVKQKTASKKKSK